MTLLFTRWIKIFRYAMAYMAHPLGTPLTAVGIDPNDCIYPIAMAVVEVECKDSWMWFLNTLKSDLGIKNTYPWTIMTDKQMVIS